MLQTYQMVREAKESLYTGVCSVIEKVKVVRENKSTGFKDTVVLENIPCRLSIKSLTNAVDSSTINNITKVTKLFISPDVDIKPGSKLIVTQNGVTAEYKNSGIPIVYSTHQEVILEAYEERS